jgi:phage baseplate assembly protein gpV
VDFDLVGEAAATITVADGAVTLDRDATSSNSSITWTAIDFAHDRCESN